MTSIEKIILTAKCKLVKMSAKLRAMEKGGEDIICCRKKFIFYAEIIKTIECD